MRRGLLDRDWQKAYQVVLTILGCLALLWALWQILSPISGIVVLFLLSWVLAFVLAAPVNALAAPLGRRETNHRWKAWQIARHVALCPFPDRDQRRLRPRAVQNRAQSGAWPGHYGALVAGAASGGLGSPLLRESP